MKVLTTFALVLMVSLFGAAQENSSQDDTQQQATPTTISFPDSGSPRGQVPPEAPGERGVPRNSLQVGVNVNASYDSMGNVADGGDSTIGEGMVFRLNSESPNRHSTFSYEPSYSYRTGGGQSNNFSQALDASTIFRLGNRWNLRLQNGFRMTTDPFQSVTSLPSLESPNVTIATPYSTQTTEVASAELDAHVTKRTSLGVVGNFGMQRYKEVAGIANPNQTLLNSTNSSGRVFVRYAFSKRFTAGLEGQYQDLLTGESFSRVQSYSAVAYTSLQLTKHSQLTLFGGPQRSHLRNQVFLDLGLFVLPLKVVRWSTEGTGGASYSLQMKHSRFFTSYENRITDGGGLVGPVTLNSATAGFDHDFTRRWSGGLAFNFGNNAALAAKNTLRTYSGSATVRRKLTRDMNLMVSYQNINQDQTPHTGGFVTGNRNRVYASLEYVWTHPLGR